jgi:peptidoglycan/LPS O-acetylase OafA/YrhL
MISYPIYIIHYPFVYTYTAWVAKTKTPLADALPVTVGTFLICITVAYICLTFYDIPIRQLLNKRLIQKSMRHSLTPAVDK